jgi:hypothetical protein
MPENCSMNTYASTISQKLIAHQLENMFQKLAFPSIYTAAKGKFFL